MSKDKAIKDQIAKISCRINGLQNHAVVLLKGKRVKIISDYTGQPFGSSRPSLKGHEFNIEAVQISGSRCEIWDGTFDHCFMGIDEVEFV